MYISLWIIKHQTSPISNALDWLIISKIINSRKMKTIGNPCAIFLHFGRIIFFFLNHKGANWALLMLRDNWVYQNQGILSTSRDRVHWLPPIRRRYNWRLFPRKLKNQHKGQYRVHLVRLAPFKAMHVPNPPNIHSELQI